MVTATVKTPSMAPPPTWQGSHLLIIAEVPFARWQAPPAQGLSHSSLPAASNTVPGTRQKLDVKMRDK